MEDILDYNQIIFWKWDDSDFHNDTFLKKIDDLADRSVFDTLLVALTWCKPSLHEKAGHDAIAAAAKCAHERGIKMLFDIDVRPAREEFFRRYPDRKLGITQPIMLTLTSNGSAAGETSTGKSGDHYGAYYPVSFRMLRAYAYKTCDGCYDPESLRDITSCCTLEVLEQGHAKVSVDCGSEMAGMETIVFAVAEYDYPDLFSDEIIEFHSELLESYSDVMLDGATVDEWGAFPYPGFDFSGAWRRPWYSDAFAELYREWAGRDLVLDFLNTRIPPSDDPSAQFRAIYNYYTLLRERNVEIETFFYNSVKRIWGKDAFVGVHPTWFAIEEVANTPEIWKNGLDWWDVPRDFGQTDEIMIYPVRLALAHKWGGAVFYNMWYTIGSLELESYWLEAWENLRWGGRTHTLGYECVGERGCVMELSGPGDLESVSQIEELISLANLFQRTAAKSNVAVVMGYPATVNWTLNVEDGSLWDMRKGVFPEAFTVARDIFNAGFTCDLIASYEIDDGDLRLEDGKLSYGSETYDALVYVHPEFSTDKTLGFLEELVSMDYPTAILGECRKDSRGSGISTRFADLTSRAGLAQDTTDSASVISALADWNITRNDIPNGARFQDGSIVICNRGKVHRGNLLSVENVEVNGYQVDAVCEDAFGIALADDGSIDRLFGGKLAEVRVDGELVFKSSDPIDIYIERSGSNYRIATVNFREIIWSETDNLLS